MGKTFIVWVILAILLLAGLLYTDAFLRTPRPFSLRDIKERLTLLFQADIPQDHRNIRLQIIEFQASQRRQWDVLFVGDSIVEALRPDILIDQPSLNAGVGGTGIRFIQKHLFRLLSITKPSRVVVLTGINDALEQPWRDTSTFTDSWASLYEAVAESIVQEGATPILVSILPPENGRLIPDAKMLSGLVSKMNKKMKDLSCSHAYIFIDAYSGLLKSGLPLTTDGVHPTPEAYRQLADEIRGAVGDGWATTHRNHSERCSY